MAERKSEPIGLKAAAEILGMSTKALARRVNNRSIQGVRFGVYYVFDAAYIRQLAAERAQGNNVDQT